MYRKYRYSLLSPRLSYLMTTASSVGAGDKPAEGLPCLNGVGTTLVESDAPAITHSTTFGAWNFLYHFSNT